MSQFYQFYANSLQGKPILMSEFEGKVLLVVNTASDCGFTYQYEGLEELYQTYKDKGLVILGFPCNQFGQQEKGDNQEIESFCQVNYGVSFPMFEKIDVNGDEAHPIFKFLTESKKGLFDSERIKWNFTKFLINQNGEVLKRYGSITKPKRIAKDIAQLLE